MGQDGKTGRSRSGKRASVGGREGSSGGLRTWWSKFSGRFKKLTPIPGVGGEEVSAEIALGNDLHYKQLVPQSAVFTLGFTPSDGNLLAKEQKLAPSFPRPGLADRGMPEGGGGGQAAAPPHTQTLLSFASSPSSSPSSSLVVSSRSSRKSKSRSSKPSMATVLAKVGLQRLQPILDAQEVDLPALLELDEEDLKELGVRDSTERE